MSIYGEQHTLLRAKRLAIVNDITELLNQNKNYKSKKRFLRIKELDKEFDKVTLKIKTIESSIETKKERIKWEKKKIYN